MGIILPPQPDIVSVLTGLGINVPGEAHTTGTPHIELPTWRSKASREDEVAEVIHRAEHCGRRLVQQGRVDQPGEPMREGYLWVPFRKALYAANFIERGCNPSGGKSRAYLGHKILTLPKAEIVEVNGHAPARGVHGDAGILAGRLRGAQRR